MIVSARGHNKGRLGPAYASGYSSFSKSTKGKILFFLHEVEEVISAIFIQV